MRHEENRCFRGGREVRKEMGVLGNSGDWETGVSGETGKIRGGGVRRDRRVMGDNRVSGGRWFRGSGDIGEI